MMVVILSLVSLYFGIDTVLSEDLNVSPQKQLTSPSDNVTQWSHSSMFLYFCVIFDQSFPIRGY